ncbi:Gfo/Idh/MocA family protein [Pantanalinema rosaneae CENA516]|uniref:Gfo/Idh/MocA family protein n=1 Tax=Pantanalinema rosaneae TaxID=1620701 RepID=UPI003D701F0A
MPKPIRWGILGTGFISGQFAQGLQLLPDAELRAIGSRTQTAAQEFARCFNVPRTYSRYEELVKDPDIDVVYVGTPHHRHQADCLMCLEAGKAVVCEKPFMLNAQEAREVIELARAKQLFCMEAMWMRFMPLIQQVQTLINSGEIGTTRLLTADFGTAMAYDPKSRFFNLELGGGALLDRGVYLLSLAIRLFGTPESVVSQATIGETGVDEQSAIVLKFPQGQLATLSCSLRSYSTNEAVIVGDRGKIVIHEPFYRPHRISVMQSPEPVALTTGMVHFKPGLKQKLKQHPLVQRFKGLLMPLVRKSTTIVEPIAGNGFGYEAAEVMRCLRNGELESPLMPLDETLRIMETMDLIRSQWKLKYPQEE